MLSWIELNRNALRRNAESFMQLVGPDRAFFVVKSNSYGHGLSEVVRELMTLSPVGLATNYLHEAVTIRSLGFTGRVMMMGPCVPSEFAEAAKARVEMFLGHDEALDIWCRLTDKPSIHVEFDTGMSRQGFQPSRAAEIAAKLSSHKQRVKGICMHFANVEDVTEHSYADQQLAKFKGCMDTFESAGLKVERHAASSASALILDPSRFDLSRIGISLYGFWPSLATKISYSQLHPKKLLDIEPVLTWKARLTNINTVESGQYVGYGCTYRARKTMRVGVVPVGYYEGYPRAVSGSPAYVLVKGQRAPIVGRICMNMMMVDVSDITDVKVLDEVVLIGKQNDEVITASDVGAWSQTIHYEIVTRLHPAIPRKCI